MNTERGLNWFEKLPSFIFDIRDTVSINFKPSYCELLFTLIKYVRVKPMGTWSDKWYN